jgi:hypothetical protein
MDFTSLASLFGMGGGSADAGASVSPPTAGALTPGQSPGAGWGVASQQGQGALNYLGNALMNKATRGGGTGGQMGGFTDTNGSGGLGASGGSGGYTGGKL